MTATEPMTGAPSDVESTEVWTYMGDRRLAKGGLCNTWQTPFETGVLVGFKTKAAVGYMYEVHRTVEGRFRLGRYIGRADVTPPEWALEHHAAQTREAQSKLERRLQRDAAGVTGDLLDSMTIGEVAGRMAKIMSRAEKRAYAVAVLERLGL